ncbi:TIGR02569 family protein [Actinokineospora sp. NBRC 105648]|uniref:TIGR02569 family protein n=1 Tax=Actinokineospora sp. NBRC 105648 TaxID=3032206 RepID=UPI0024A514F4|nr:TIGR02569 family protein [Actinokineospora sp. NBRC 105648]GLZ40518.1 TIGR02569 family protein [Actinokineospora sp. NBRC 105648]
MRTPPPPHVRAAFGAKDAEPVLIEQGPVWRCDDLALRQAANPAEASWVAQTLGDLRVPDLRIAQPVRSSDGRYVVGGWVGFRYVPGRAEPRYDEVISASLRLHKATAELNRPRFLSGRADVFAMADRAAWGEDKKTKLDPDLGGRLFALHAESRKEISLRSQVVHGDLFGNVLFDGDAAPGIIDFAAFHRPPEWAAAVVVVDAMAWGGADESIAKRWGHLPEWPQALLRALLFRLAVHALHPRSTPRSMRGLERAAQEIVKLV